MRQWHEPDLYFHRALAAVRREAGDTEGDWQRLGGENWEETHRTGCPACAFHASSPGLQASRNEVDPPRVPQSETAGRG